MKMHNKDMDKKQITEEEEIEIADGVEADQARKLADKEAELEQCQEKVMRLAAEMENFKKRIEREKSEYMKYALESFAKELLPFLDNLERAVDSVEDSRDFDKLVEGIDLTMSGCLKTMERFGIKVFTAEGQKFDPNLHEALTVQEQEEVEENTVIKEILKGYSLHDRILRPALVVVSKNTKKGSRQKETST
jgi:molecular chaperone GrpE